MQVETLDSPIAEGFLWKILSSAHSRKVPVTEEVQAKRRAPDVDWQTDRPHYLRCLVESTTYKGGPLAENDLLNIELCNDN